MTGSQFAQLIRTNTKTNATTFPDADLLLYANIAKDEIAESIVSEVGEDYFLLTWDTDLVADQREYVFPNSMLKGYKRASAFLSEHWFVLPEMDLPDEARPLVTEENIVHAYMGRRPQIDLRGRSFMLYSEQAIEDVQGGLRIEAYVYPSDIEEADLSSIADLSIPKSTSEHALPRAAHLLWATKVQILYKTSKEKPIPLTQIEKNIAALEAQTIKNLKKPNIGRVVQPSMPHDTGHHY